MYQIQHPWEQLNTQKTELSTNSWLMSYGQGIQLPYIHWEQISHPKFIIPIFKSDASGEMAGNTTNKTKILEKMELRADAENMNIGKFGCWRRDSKSICTYDIGIGNKNHHGIDLMASVGTPIYLPFKEASVIKIIGEDFRPRNEAYKNLAKDVDGISKQDGKNGCHYRKDSFGKQIIVKCRLENPIKGIDGKEYTEIYLLFAHLNHISQSKGKIDTTKKIAECGCSGNAASLDENKHHLHLEASTNDNDFVKGKKRNIDVEKLFFK